MGYLYLLISLLSGITKGYCGKRTSGYITTNSDAFFTNIIRLILCVVIGFCLVLFGDGVKTLIPSGSALLFSAMSGISTAVFLVTWLLSVKNGTYMLVEVILMMGVLVPILSGIVLFGNQVEWNQWAGLVILVISVFLMSSYNKSLKGNMSLKTTLILIGCGLASGVTNLSQKLFVEYQPHTPISVFQFYTYLFAGIILIAVLLQHKKSEPVTVTVKSVIGYLIVMAVCLFCNSFFTTLAAKYLDPMQLYPLNQGLALIFSTAMSAILFHERLTAKAVLGILLSFVGIIFINVI